VQPTITEIAPDTFLISIYPPGSPVSFYSFLSCDDEPETCDILDAPFYSGSLPNAAAG
jgi:hypothetical protein